MSRLVGQVINGVRASYRLMQPLKGDTVFKAQILEPRDLDQQWAVVKMATDDLERAVLRREYRNYQHGYIAASPFIRKMYEGIGDLENIESPVPQIPPCLVLEWMDTELRSVPSSQFRSGELPKHISRSVLSALEVFYFIDAVHTDVNPNNILISGIHDPTPTVKLSDLGMLLREGFKGKRLQSLPCRAPEVWKGLGVEHVSDVWSLGATLVHWLMGKTIFGAQDKRIAGLTEAYRIAKLERLVGPVGPLPKDMPAAYADEFDTAAALKDLELDPPWSGKLITVLPLRRELERLSDPPAPTGLIDFIESLLVIDMDKRPIALDALEHPYLKLDPSSESGT